MKDLMLQQRNNSYSDIRFKRAASIIQQKAKQWMVNNKKYRLKVRYGPSFMLWTVHSDSDSQRCSLRM